MDRFKILALNIGQKISFGAFIEKTITIVEIRSQGRKNL
jgi:hypothetical protein